MSVRCLTPANLSRISLNVGPLYTGLISILLSLARSRHNHILPFIFGTMTKLLYYSDDSSAPGGTTICCFCSQSTSSLRGSWSIYATLLQGASYGQLPPFTCNINVPLKHPIPEKQSLNSLCIFINIWLTLVSGALFMLDLK